MPPKPPNIFKRVKRKLKKERIKEQISMLKIIGVSNDKKNK